MVIDILLTLIIGGTILLTRNVDTGFIVFFVIVVLLFVLALHKEGPVEIITPGSHN